jgi:hypothetical protein
VIGYILPLSSQSASGNLRRSFAGINDSATLVLSIGVLVGTASAIGAAFILFVANQPAFGIVSSLGAMPATG